MKKQPLSCPAPLSIIDIGTNTLRLLIGCVKDGRLLRIATDRSVTRLGKNLLNTGTLNKESIEESIKSLIKFKEVSERYGARKILAIGTSALRDAQNRDKFLKDVKRQTGINIHIISGDKEAELTLKGILGYVIKGPNNLAAPLFIVDVGGGSTEWVFCNGKCKKGSIQIGAVKLYENFILHDPPMPNELQRAKNHISEYVNLSILNQHINLSPKTIKSFVATGGTATTAAAMDLGLNEYDGNKIHLHRISFSVLNELFKKISSLPIAERYGISGLEYDRADIIVPGIMILLTIMEILKKDELIISDYGLLEGMLIDSESFQ